MKRHHLLRTRDLRKANDLDYVELVLEIIADIGVRTVAIAVGGAGCMFNTSQVAFN
jgi:hypothetical protein